MATLTSNPALIISIIAAVISFFGLWRAWVSSRAARRSAWAAEESLYIQRDRRLEELQPQLTAVIKGTGRHRSLWITMNSGAPVASLDVAIIYCDFYGTPTQQGAWDFEFEPRAPGVVPPSRNHSASYAYSCDERGRRAGLQQFESISWPVITKDRLAKVGLDVICYGVRGEQWEMRLEAVAQRETSHSAY